MAKKSEINKKGRLAKSTLSVVLAASMVLTSSSFVWAAPVEDIAIVEEGDAAVEAVEVPVEEATGTGVEEVTETSVEDNVGAVLDSPFAVVDPTVVYNGTEQKPVKSVKTAENGVVISPNDYTVTYEDNINVTTQDSKAKFTIKFKTGTQYEGTKDITGEFSITALELSANDTKIEFKPTTGIFYNGKVQTPETVVKTTLIDGTEITIPAKDYKLIGGGAAYDLKSAGTQKAKLAPADNSQNITVNGDILSEEYIIDEGDFNENTVTVTSRPVLFPDPTQLIPKAEADVTVKNKTTGDELAEGVDYTFQYYNAKGEKTDTIPQDIGKYRLDVIGKGNYRSDSITTTFEIVKDLSMQQILDYIKESVGDGLDFTYNFKEQGYNEEMLEALFKNQKDTLEAIRRIAEFDFSEAKGTDVGTYNIKLIGRNIYAGQTATGTYKITPLRITGVVPEDDNVAVGKFMYTATLGKSHSGVMGTKAALTLKYKLDKDTVVTLEEGKDYTYTTDTMKKEVVITGLGNFTTVDPENEKVTTIKLPYDENKNALALSDPSITATVSGTYNYTGYSITPSIDKLTVVENDTTPYTLQGGTDFVIEKYGENKNAGEGTIVIKPATNSKYTGKRTVTFKISGTALDSVYKIADIKDIKIEDINAPADGKVTPKVVRIDTGATAPSGVWDSASVKYYRNGKLMEDADFGKSGAVEVVVSGIGQYEGTLKTTYNIVGYDIAKVAKVVPIADQNYTGKAIEPTVTVELIEAGKTLVKDKDYTVTYDNNIKSGTAYANVTGMGDYSGKIVTSFKIVGQMEQNFEFLAAQVRDIKKRTLASNETVVKYEKDKDPKTTVTYSSSDEKVFTVDAKTGAIAYTGVGTATLTASAVESDIYKAETKTMTIRVVPRTPGNVSVTSTSAKKINITADEVEEAAYYQIKIWKVGHDPVFVNVKNVGDLNKVYTTKSSGTFKVQVRTFMYPGTKVPDNYLSKFSPTYTVVVKK